MTENEILQMTKFNLAILGTAYDSYLLNLINAAKNEIGTEGITLDTSSVSDCNLIVMYAAYLFRKRAEDNPVMPRMLRYALNNRLFSEKVST